MLDVSLVVNKIFSKFISTVKIHELDRNYCYFPSTICVSLLALAPFLDWPKCLRDFFEFDIQKVVENEEDINEFMRRLSRLVVRDHDAVIESFVKLFIYRKTQHSKVIKHRLFSILDVEHEHITSGEVDVLNSMVHEWSKTKLGIRELQLLKFDISHIETDSLCVANTFHISANWKHVFDLTQTRVQKFRTHLGSHVEVETMFLRETLRTCVHEELDVNVIELPFAHPHLCALLVHPVKEEIVLSTVLQKINVTFIDDCFSLFRQNPIALHLPKLKFNTHIGVASQLVQNEIVKVAHQTVEGYRLIEHTQATFLNVNEYGISSKFAHRSVSRVEREVQITEKSIHVINRPFIFIIFDTHHRCPLFVSAIHDPLRI